MLTHNWGWAIVLLVILIVGAVPAVGRAVPVDGEDAQKFQPRIEQLWLSATATTSRSSPDGDAGAVQEREDQPGRRLPADPDPDAGVLALYYVLLEVELRQAPWILGWINDLTARPYFILPVVNGAVQRG